MHIPDDDVAKFDAAALAVGLDGLRLLTRSMPLQVEGVVRGRSIYFRFRWGSWELSQVDDVDTVLASGEADDLTYEEVMAIIDANVPS